MYTTHNRKHIEAVNTFENIGPPSSPPITTLLAVSSMKHKTEQSKNIATVKLSFPAGTSYGLLILAPYYEHITHGNPRPKKMFTELEPVTLPTAESAYGEPWAAVIDANVSGRDVPTATKVMALTAVGMCKQHPKISATSPTTKVTIPTIASAMKKAGQPP